MDGRSHLFRILGCLAAGSVIGAVCGWVLGSFSPHFVSSMLQLPYSGPRTEVLGGRGDIRALMPGLMTDSEIQRTGVALGAVNGLFVGLAVAALLTIGSVFGRGHKTKDLPDR